MKAHTNELLTIEEIVDKVLLDLLYGSHHKEQFLSFALEYYKIYRMDLAREYKKVRLTMTPWKSIMIPEDCVDWIAVGVSNGESFDVFVNKRLNPRDCACDEDEPTSPVYIAEAGSEGVSFNSINEFGEDVGKQNLTVKDNGLGYFDPNRTRVNEIQLSTNVSSTTRPTLLYLSSLIDPTIDKCVHPYAQHLIEKGIHFSNMKNRRRRGDKSISQYDVDFAKDEYDEEICKVAERRFDMSTSDIMEWARSGDTMAPKG